jgi:hypothetical protein
LGDPNMNEVGFETKRNFFRNQQLIDLSFTPAKLKADILDEYAAQAGKKHGDLLKYFMSNKLRNLTDAIGDF